MEQGQIYVMIVLVQVKRFNIMKYIYYNIILYKIQLVVIFENDESDRVVNPTKLEAKKIQEADGITLIDIREKKLKHFEWSQYPMINDTINMLLGTVDIVFLLHFFYSFLIEYKE